MQSYNFWLLTLHHFILSQSTKLLTLFLRSFTTAQLKLLKNAQHLNISLWAYACGWLWEYALWDAVQGICYTNELMTDQYINFYQLVKPTGSYGGIKHIYIYAYVFMSNGIMKIMFLQSYLNVLFSYYNKCVVYYHSLYKEQRKRLKRSIRRKHTKELLIRKTAT